MTSNNGYAELVTNKALELPEVGEPLDLELGPVRIRTTFIGAVGTNGWTLTDACRLMCEMAEEREACSEG